MALTPGELLSKLIEAEVKSGQPRLSEKNVKEIKQVCRVSEDNVRDAFRLLRQHLENDHSEVRFSAFLLMKELFDRSNVFRELLIDGIHEFCVLVAEIDKTKPLPLPKPTAVKMKDLAVLTLKMWYDKYGSTYKKLRLAFEFLLNTKKIVLREESASDLFRPDVRNQVVRKNADRARIDKVNVEMEESGNELDILLTEIETLFGIIIPDFGTEERGGSASGTLTCEDTNTPNLRHHGLPSTSYTVQIELRPSSLVLQKNPENEPLIDKIKENTRLLNSKFRPMLTRWLTLLSKSGADLASLKTVIDTKFRLENALQKGVTLGITTTDSASKKSSPSGERAPKDEAEGNSSDDEFVDVSEVGSTEYQALADFPPITSRIRTVQETVRKTDTNNLEQPCCSKSVPMERTSARQEALAAAPVVPFGLDLEDWGKEKTLTSEAFQSPYESLHRFWRPPEVADGFTNQEVNAAMTTRLIPFVGMFEPVKWSCRAPLLNGLLCSRKDRVKCPFHGKIIPRNELGEPEQEEDRLREQREKEKADQDKIPDWQDPELLKDIEAETGLDLKVEPKRKKKKTNLSDVDKMLDTPRTRLAKKILRKSTVKRISNEMDEQQKKQAAEKFAHNWNYIS